MANERLTTKITVDVDRTVRKIHLVVKERVVFGWATNLDDLRTCGTLEHTVSDMWRLKHTVALVEPKRRPLVLIDDIDPTAMAEDHLKTNGVMMHQIGNRTAVAHLDV